MQHRSMGEKQSSMAKAPRSPGARLVSDQSFATRSTRKMSQYRAFLQLGIDSKFLTKIRTANARSFEHKQNHAMAACLLFHILESNYLLGSLRQTAERG